MYEVCVISARRPANVPKVNARIGGHRVTWFVGNGEADAYACYGAADVIEAGSLIDARNAALEYCFARGLACVQLSDDIGAIKDARTGTAYEFSDLCKELVSSCEAHGARLAGVAPTANAFYFDPERSVKRDAFIVGDLFAALPSAPRFDKGLRLKEDYDFTAQHLQAFGSVARLEYALVAFAHRSNKGGAVDYRTAALEKEAIAYLMAKWPGVFRENPKRPNEILMRWKGRATE